jgi:flagellar basal-body rod protein FlgB
MDRTSQRHALVSTNLANVNVPGYKRRDIDFGILLEQDGEPSALQRARAKAGQAARAGQGSVRVDGNSVDLEQEVVALAESELRYSLLAEVAGRYFSGLKNVIREGK